MSKPLALSKAKREKLLTQVKEEYDFALKYRQRRHASWQSVDDLYYGKKKQSLVSRANVHIPKMQGTIEVFVSKVDDSPFIEFDPMEEGDKKAARFNNSFLAKDRSDGDWDLIDVLGKKEAALYGRTIFKKYSTSEGGFKDFLEVVDVYDFLIDPLAGGIKPITNARFMGQDNIIRTPWQLADDSIYDQKAVKKLKREIQSDNDADSQDNPKQARRNSLGLTDAVFVSGDALSLVEWYTEYEGEMFYTLVDKDFTEFVRITLLEDMTTMNEAPFVTWAPFARANEFWTPGLGELIAEPNVIQNTIMSQILDNNTYRNYGMKAYDVDNIVNPAQLTPRPMGKVGVTGNPKDIIMDIPFPTLNNALETYKMVDQVYDKETGITAQAKGAPNSKRMSATEFAGLLDQVADRFFTANKTYASSLKRIAKLYYYGLQDNMTKTRAIRILGAKGHEWKKLTAKDLKLNSFDVIVSSGITAEQNKNLARDRFGEFVTRYQQDTSVNQNFLKEKDAINNGFTPEEVKRFMSPEMEGDWEILSEAASENEIMLSKDVEPNRGSTIGHIQKHLDFARMSQDLEPKVIERITKHAQAEMAFVVGNETRRQDEAPQELPQAQGAPSPLSPQGGPINFPEQVRATAITNAPPNA